MKNQVLKFSLLLVVVFTTSTLHVAAQKASGLSFLSKTKGKYPTAVNLLTDARLKARFVKMLTKETYNQISDIWQVESPIKVEGDFFYAYAMAKSSGGDPGVTILANLKTNKLYVKLYADGIGIYYAEGSKLEMKAEARDEIPADLLAWGEKQ